MDGPGRTVYRQRREMAPMVKSSTILCCIFLFPFHLNHGTSEQLAQEICASRWTRLWYSDRDFVDVVPQMNGTYWHYRGFVCRDGQTDSLDMDDQHLVIVGIETQKGEALFFVRRSYGWHCMRK